MCCWQGTVCVGKGQCVLARDSVSFAKAVASVSLTRDSVVGKGQYVAGRLHSHISPWSAGVVGHRGRNIEFKQRDKHTNKEKGKQKSKQISKGLKARYG